METTIKSTASKTGLHSQTINTSSPFWEKLEFNRYGIIAMLILIIGCMGGIAASFGADGNALKISAVAFPTVIALSLMLAVSPMRMIVYVSGLAILLDFIVLIF